jgi:hypothetical protein
MAFTAENTEGYTAEELAALAQAMAILLDDVDPDAVEDATKSIADRLNNIWQPGMTAAELVAAF